MIHFRCDIVCVTLCFSSDETTAAGVLASFDSICLSTENNKSQLNIIKINNCFFEMIFNLYF